MDSSLRLAQTGMTSKRGRARIIKAVGLQLALQVALLAIVLSATGRANSADAPDRFQARRG